MKKMIKILFFILISVIIFTISSTNISYAGGTTGIGEIISGADDFISDGASDQPIKDSNLQELSNSLYTVLLVIGIVVAVIVGLVIGVKFMTGSVAEKAKVKETLIPYIAGCIVVFGAFAIWKLVVEVLSMT